jgi:hypothetical protein
MRMAVLRLLLMLCGHMLMGLSCRWLLAWWLLAWWLLAAWWLLRTTGAGGRGRCSRPSGLLALGRRTARRRPLVSERHSRRVRQGSSYARGMDWSCRLRRLDSCWLAGSYWGLLLLGHLSVINSGRLLLLLL